MIVRIIWISIFAVCSIQLTQGQKVKASEFGFDRVNSTNCLLEAVWSNYDTIIVDKQESDWYVEPIIIKNLSHKVIYIEAGVEIKALPEKFKGLHDELIRFENVSNVKLIGRGAKFSMNKAEYTHGEWRHALSLRKCKNIVIRGLELRNSGGDGIYISGLEKGSFSENILIENVISDNNRRQGISLISVQNLIVRNSEFTKTNGTLPEAGVDIEPNHPDNRIVNVTFENCIFSENNHSGIKIALHNLNSASIPVSILFDNCMLRSNHHPENPQAPSEISIGANKKDPVKGHVLFEECFIESSNWGILHSRKRSDAFEVRFKDCFAENICKMQTMPPFALEVPDYYRNSGSLGGIDFGDFYVSYSVPLPVFNIRGSKMQTLRLEDVKGKIILESEQIIQSYIDYIQYDPSYNMKVDLKFIEKIP